MENEKKSGKKKIIIPIIIGAVLLVLIIGGVIIGAGVKAAVSKVGNSGGIEVVPVETRDLSESLSFKGTLSGETKTNISSKAASEVVSVDVQVGDVVKEGDLLCELDSKSIEEALEKANVNVANAKALADKQSAKTKQELADAKEDRSDALKAAQEAIDAAKEDYEAAQTDYNEMGTVLDNAKKELASYEEAMNKAKEAYENADEEHKEEAKKAYENALKAYEKCAEQVASYETTYSGLKAEMDAAEKAVKAAEATYSETEKTTDRAVAACQDAVDMEKYQAEDSSMSDTVKDLLEQYNDCKVYATASGVVTAVNVSVGDNNTPGVTMITIEDNEHMKLVVDVEEKDILKLSEGMTAEVTSDVLEDVVLKGEVSRVVRVKNQSVNPEEMTAGTGYTIEITVEKSDLLIGMSARAKVSLRQKKNVLSVPYDMVQTDENGQEYVLIAEDAGNDQKVATRVNITTGDVYDYYVEVTGGDLQAGDLLIMDSFIAEGTQFTALEDYYMNVEEE